MAIRDGAAHGGPAGSTSGSGGAVKVMATSLDAGPPPGRLGATWEIAGSAAAIGACVNRIWRESSNVIWGAKPAQNCDGFAPRSPVAAAADGGGSSNSSWRRNQNDHGACGQPSGTSSSSACPP